MSSSPEPQHVPQASPSSPRPSSPTPAPPLRPSSLVAGRYQLLNELGRGAMSSIHRVLDRLTGRVVTLKRLQPASTAVRESYGMVTRSRDRLALAQEFRVLASLRHPNIINVLDYGFDDDGLPFFTMDLQENASSIVGAALAAPLAVRVELLIQMLRALTYLHRHGIIHRDLKPDNVVVVNDHVKVLDFGLSIGRDLAAESATWTGTLPYMAPEVIAGAPPSVRSDLYSAGMIAYEMLVGAYPFPCENALALQLEIQRTRLPRASDEIDPRLRSVLGRLLAKTPIERYADAAEAIAAVVEAFPHHRFAAETAATRESFLQAAPLVGRACEMARLRAVLREAVERRGSAWMLAGESGVGKTRLLEELRAEALVEGMLVVRGQAVSHGGGPYHLWRDVLRALLLKAGIDDVQAGILKAVVPDIGELLDRTVADAPPVDSEAARSRLLRAVEDLFRSLRQPVLVEIEDLHWAGSESRRMLATVARIAAELPVLVVGSYRDDEAPALLDGLPEVRQLRLQRLQEADVTLLGEAMIGPAAQRPELAALLVRETEGIPFFIVEVIRALAESSGDLASVGRGDLPRRIMSGGMRRVLRTRLDRLSPQSLAILETAAVIGKVVDRPLLEAIHRDLDFEGWISECAAAAVLDLDDQNWIFAHDKLREHLLESLPDSEAPRLHRRVAESIESAHADEERFVTALAHHWRVAGDPASEARYVQRAGEIALRSAAYEEAVRYFERALELLRGAASPESGTASQRRRGRFLNPLAGIDPRSATYRLGVLEGGLAEAHYRLGELSRCRSHAEAALGHFGQPSPNAILSWPAGIAIEAVRRLLQAARAGRDSSGRESGDVSREVTAVQIKLTETFIYSLQAMPAVWSALRTINVSEPAGPSTHLAYAYVLGGLVAGGAGVSPLAESWCQRALRVAEGLGHRAGITSMLSRAAIIHIGMCRWDEAAVELGRAESIAEEIGDLRVCEETRTQAAILALYHGPLEPGLAPVRTARALLDRSRSRQAGCWIVMAEGDLLQRLGRPEDAAARYGEAIDRLDERAMISEAIWAYGGMSLARLRLGDAEAAYAAAKRSLWFMLNASFVACWTQQGMAATAEVLLALWERDWRPAGSTIALREECRLACKRLRGFARHFALGRSPAMLWTALYWWLAGRHGAAERRWLRTVSVAERLGTPYELARAHLELGMRRRGSREGAATHLVAAERILGEYGCEHERNLARAALERIGAASA